MYTKDKIEAMPEKKQTMINNYINKVINTNWNNEKDLTYDKCLNFYIVQEYIKYVDLLTDYESNKVNI